MNILMVCTGNTCRSPMAQVLLQQLAKERGLSLCVKSAGLAAQPGHPATENAQLAVNEVGANLSQHRSNQLDETLLKQADLVFVMTQQQKLILQPYGANVMLLDERGITDPYGGTLDDYRVCRDQIKAALVRLADEGVFHEG